MRKLFGRLHIGLSSSGVAVAETHGWLRPQIHRIADISLPANETALPEQLAEALDNALAEHRAGFRAATVMLADDLVRLFLVTPPHNAARLQDCVSAAHMRFQALYGETPAAWRIEADYHATQPFLACAVPKDLLDALHIAAAKQRLTLVEIVPHFIACWNIWRGQWQESSWLGVVHANSLTLAAVQGQRIAMVRSAAISAAAKNDESWLATHISKEAIRWNLPVPSHVHLHGDFPAHWLNTAGGEMQCTGPGPVRSRTHDPALSPRMMLACTGLCR